MHKICHNIHHAILDSPDGDRFFRHPFSKAVHSVIATNLAVSTEKCTFRVTVKFYPPLYAENCAQRAQFPLDHILSRRIREPVAIAHQSRMALAFQ